MENKRSIFRRCLHTPYGLYNPRHFFGDAKGSKTLIQRLKLEVKLPVHNGCVNSICWNDAGEFILSGSDDQLLCITNGYTHKVLASIHSGHRANIFSAKFLPNTRDRQIISCSGDGTIMFTEVERPDLYGMNAFDCHFGTAYEIVTVPNDPYSFLSCGEDGTIRWFDLRMKTRCNVEDCIEDILINCRRAVTSLAVNSLIPYHLAVGCSDSTVRLFDRRMLGTRATGNYTGRGIQGMFSRFIAPSLVGKSHRITSLQYSPDGWEVLVSYSSDYVYLFSIKEMEKYENKESLTKAKKFDAEFSNQNTPPMKRLRLRGDWSDTGPNARPESELQGERSPHVTLMQRMSDMLSRWLEDSSRLRQEGTDQRGGRLGQNRQVNNPESGESSESIEDSTSRIEDDNQEIDLSVQNINHETLLVNTEENRSIVLPMGSIPEILIPINSFPENNHSLTTNSSDSTNILVENIFSQVSENSQPNPTAENSQPNPTDSENSQLNPTDSENSQLNPEKIHHSVKILDLSEIIDPVSARDNSVKSSEMIFQSSNEAETSLTNNEVALDSSLPSQWTNNSDLIRVDIAKTSVADRCIFDLDLPVQQSFNSDLSFPERHDSALELTKISDSPMEFAGGGKASCSMNDDKNLELPFLDSEMEVTLESDLESEQTSLIEMVQNNHVSNKPELISNDHFNESAGLNYSLKSSTSDRAFCDNIEQIESIISETENVTTMVASSTENITPIIASTDVTMITSSTEDLTMVASTEDDSTMITMEDVTALVASTTEDAAMITSTDVTTMVTSTDVTTIVESSTGDVASMVASSVSQSLNIQASGSTEYTGDILALSERREDRDSLQRRTSDPGQSGSGLPRRNRRFGVSVDFNVEDLTWQSSEEEHSSDDIAPRNRTWRRMPSQQLETPEQERRNNAARQIQEIFRKREKEKEDLELMSIPQPSVQISFRGHRNARTMIKEANFWGEHFVMSGSDCGHIFIWDRHTAELVMIMEADQHVVNCLQPHPFDPVLATSGIDYDIKLWSPLAEEPSFDKDIALEIIRRNEIMLEETRDTITVPASFMIRMLASLNHIRAGRFNVPWL